MPKITPLQTSFAAGELSPLMYQRSDTQGYQQGLAEMYNFIPDSRGPAVGRSGSHYITQAPGNDVRVVTIPVNDNFFYTAGFLHEKLIIGSISGHNPSISYVTNPHFNLGSAGWVSGTDGNPSSTVIFTYGIVTLTCAATPARYAYVSQNIILPATGNYSLDWSYLASLGDNVRLKIGTTENGGDIYDVIEPSRNGSVTVNITSTNVWVTAIVESSTGGTTADILYLGVTDLAAPPVEFVTPYQEEDLAALQWIQSPSGTALYIVHENYPPYKLTYDRATDAFTWIIVTFTAPPAAWTGTNWPSCGDFFEGRLWLGGTIDEPQTFWASKSGSPEDFTQGTLADDGMTFTMAKYGRIRWMVGFKNLLIGTTNGEHIVTSDAGVITPSDIQVNQQSSYGSANVQPVLVGDQVFYVSADGRKLRAIQYEWQADNWLSRDLTFNSEHITEPGIRHVAWHQNPNNLFHCVLNDGTLATLTYERSNNIYGWCRLVLGGDGVIKDIASGSAQGTDYVNLGIQYDEGFMNFETQTPQGNTYSLDSWVSRSPDTPGGLTVSGLDHLEGKTVGVLVDGAVHPDVTVSSGAITLQYTGTLIVIGYKFQQKFVTLPTDFGSPTGSGASWNKRWNKIFVRLITSTKPLINGARPPERHPATPMDTPEPAATEDIQVVNLGYSRFEQITVEQDLPLNVRVLGLYGELGQEIL
jgi:hypothetical protein